MAIPLFAAALFSGTPLFAILGGAAILLFYFAGDTAPAAVIVEMARIGSIPGITAIPLFIFAGFIFAESRCAERLVRLSRALVGWMPGGLAVVTVIVGTVFSAMTGGSGITIVACGGILMPALVSSGYGEKFSLGLVTASASSGVLFAPSLPIIVYGMVAGCDITELFIAGLLPGLLMAGLLAGCGVFHGVRKKIPRTPFSLAELAGSARAMAWELPLPVIVIGGIYGGFITAVEAASVAAVYALFSECVVYREIPAGRLPELAVKSMVMVGGILILLGAAMGLTNFMVDREIPQLLMAWIGEHVTGRIAFLLALNLFLLAAGCLMDIFSAIVVVVPLILPAAAAFGIDPVHLAILFLANLEIGYLTPPVGINLFLSSLRFNVPVTRIYPSVVRFLLLLALALILISYWPKLSLFLLDLTGKRVPLIRI